MGESITINISGPVSRRRHEVQKQKIMLVVAHIKTFHYVYSIFDVICFTFGTKSLKAENLLMLF